MLTNVDTVTALQHDSLVSKIEAYHPPLNIKIPLYQNGKEKVLKSLKVTVYDYSKANYLEMYNLIQRQSWTKLYTIKDVDTAAEHFQNVMNTIISQTVPAC